MPNQLSLLVKCDAVLKERKETPTTNYESATSQYKWDIVWTSVLKLASLHALCVYALYTIFTDFHLGLFVFSKYLFDILVNLGKLINHLFDELMSRLRIRMDEHVRNNCRGSSVVV